jgi:hypothetical protein
MTSLPVADPGQKSACRKFTRSVLINVLGFRQADFTGLILAWKPDSFRVADQPDGAREQPVMKRRGASGQDGQIWVMPPSTTSSMPVI